MGDGNKKDPPDPPTRPPPPNKDAPLRTPFPARSPSAPPFRRPSSSRPPSSRPTRRSSGSALRIANIDFDLANAARRIVDSALGLVAGERLVIAVDRARLELGNTLAEVARASGATVSMLELEALGERPLRSVPDELRVALERAQASILLAGFEEGELQMRFELVSQVEKLKLRHAHMIGVTRRSMLAGFSVDPSRILDATRAVRTRVRPDSTLRLRTAKGGDLEVKLDPNCRWIEHVGVLRPGRWENLPTGELVTSPAEVRGVFIADASMGGHFGQAAGLLRDRPVQLVIEGGICKTVRCPDLTLEREVFRFLHTEHNGDRVGAISLGTNIGIDAPIGDVSCDQNMPGLHVSFGSTFAEQTGATWNARSQITFTCAHADVDLDGSPLLRHGRYLLP